jgi:hypothetical protein
VSSFNVVVKLSLMHESRRTSAAMTAVLSAAVIGARTICEERSQPLGTRRLEEMSWKD